MSCHYRRYEPAENKIRHTIDGECWIVYNEEDGEPYSVPTPPHLIDILKKGEHILLHKNGTPVLYPDEVPGIPGIRNDLISGDLIRVEPWERGKYFLLTRNLQDRIEDGSLKWVYDKKRNAFLIQNTPNGTVIPQRIEHYVLPSDYAEGITPHIIEYSTVFPNVGGRRKSRKSRNKKRKTKCRR